MKIEIEKEDGKIIFRVKDGVDYDFMLTAAASIILYVIKKQKKKRSIDKIESELHHRYMRLMVHNLWFYF